MLLEKGVIDQFLDMAPTVRVLLQALVEEVSDFGADKQVGRYLDFVLDYLYELFFFCDLEWVLAHHHLVHHYSYRPDVYLLVVLAALEDLGADVERCPAECCAEFVVLVD